MKAIRITSIGSLTAAAVVLSGLLLSPGAQAQNAAAAYSAYNSGYLVQSGGNTYYSTTLTSKGTSEAKMYTAANDIEVAEDAYQYSHSQADQNIVTALLNRYLVTNGTDWTYDGWNDDIGWMVNIFIRGYQFTGQANYLTVAENNWNMGYNRGWDNVAGGGIWENTSKPNKDALSNNNFIFEAVSLYQLSGDATYLTKGEAIYNWMRTYMVNDTSSNNSRGVPGQVNQGINPDGSLLTGDNLYNNGTWVKAANTLYRITGTQMYHDDALLTITHVINTEPILHSTAECCGNQWAYWFTQGLSEFATDNNQWGTYLSFMQTNANTAWSHRCSLNLTWNDWRNATDCSANSDAMEMGSAAEIWQNLPPPALSLSGNWELQNVNSGLAVAVAGSSKTGGASVDQETFASGNNAMLWTITPTSGGFFQIKNVNSGLLLEVAGKSAVSGAAIHQWTAGPIIPGNDQWMPVNNSDGSYTFYNLNSYLALDVPGASKSTGVVLQQYFGNFGSNQNFKLIAH
jgi:hypothetical protein